MLPADDMTRSQIIFMLMGLAIQRKREISFLNIVRGDLKERFKGCNRSTLIRST